MPPIAPADLGEYLASHLIDPAFLRGDQFEAFFQDRQKKLLKLIEQATGQAAYAGHDTDEPEADVSDEEAGDDMAAAAE